MLKKTESSEIVSLILKDSNVSRIIFETNYVKSHPRTSLSDAKRNLTLKLVRNFEKDVEKDGLVMIIENLVFPSLDSIFTSPK